jgi:hypothetical protein
MKATILDHFDHKFVIEDEKRMLEQFLKINKDAFQEDQNKR